MWASEASPRQIETGGIIQLGTGEKVFSKVSVHCTCSCSVYIQFVHKLCTCSVYICSMCINMVHAARILFYNVYLHTIRRYVHAVYINNIICSLQMYACLMFTHNLRCYVHLNIWHWHTMCSGMYILLFQMQIPRMTAKQYLILDYFFKS